MNFFEIEHVRTVLAGQYLSRSRKVPAGGEAQAHGISIDSRTIVPGNIFVAIAGEQFDGHAFVRDAAAAGASAIVVEREVGEPGSLGVPVVRVASTRKALLRLAGAYRRTLHQTKVVAVCGSNGKSTVVRLLDAVLASKLRGTASKKSHNNDVGVPLTILAAKASDQYLVCEVGTNHPGEIATLSAIVEPDVAVITSIGREHLEFFGDVAGVAREEAAVLRSIRAGGLAVVTADSPELRPLLKVAPGVMTFGQAADADVRLTAFTHTTDAQGNIVANFVVADRLEMVLALPGRHNACNALATLLVARRLGMADGAIAAALAEARGPEMRWQFERHAIAGGFVRIINDAYNANPDSLAAAVATMRDLATGGASGKTGVIGAGRRVLILADMLELGEGSAAAHVQAGCEIATAGCFDMLIAVGELAGQAGAAAQQSKHAATAALEVIMLPRADDAAMGEAAGMLRPGDVVLLKGSRGMRLERISKVLRRGAAQGEVDVKLSGGAKRP